MTIVRDWKKLYHSLDYEDPELFITVQNFEKGHKTAYDLISEILHGWVSRVGTGKASVKELERVVRELGYNACAGKDIFIKKRTCNLFTERFFQMRYWS